MAIPVETSDGYGDSQVLEQQLREFIRKVDKEREVIEVRNKQDVALVLELTAMTDEQLRAAIPDDASRNILESNSLFAYIRNAVQQEIGQIVQFDSNQPVSGVAVAEFLVDQISVISPDEIALLRSLLHPEVTEEMDRAFSSLDDQMRNVFLLMRSLNDSERSLVFQNALVRNRQ